MQKDLAKLLMKAITLISTSLLTGTAIAGSNFTISPTPGKTFPTSVSQGSVVSAYYTITNNTHSTRSGYSVRGLPARVVQNISDPANCGNLITLASLASCTLQLDISGQVQSGFALCKGDSCTSASVPLNVSVIAAALNNVMIAGGLYVNSMAITYPWVALSDDNGTNWAYTLNSASITTPADYVTMGNINAVYCSGNNCLLSGQYSNTIADYSPMVISSSDGGKTWNYTIDGIAPALPGDYLNNGNISSTSCSGLNCVAAGSYSSGASHYPLIAASSDGGQSWNYTGNSITPALPMDFTQDAYLYTASCSGQKCIVAGQYNAMAITYPLLAASNDNGTTWTYTVNSTTPAAPPGLTNSAYFSTSFCGGDNCLAAGSYNAGANQTPMLATSSDGGLNWSYKIDSLTPALPVDFTSGYINMVSCSGQNCVAGGSYSNGAIYYPLLAASSDAGLTWSYKINSSTPALPANFLNSGAINSVSCSGLNCIAAGNYNSAITSFPLLATSKDGGSTWHYTINSTTPGLPGDFVANSYFFGASCSGQNCIAAGTYHNGVSYNPLLASSTDGGSTWSYSIDSSKPALPLDYDHGGQFLGASISVASLGYFYEYATKTLESVAIKLRKSIVPH